jgi:hypothetical protein
VRSYKGLLAARFFLGLLEGKEYGYDSIEGRLTPNVKWFTP